MRVISRSAGSPAGMCPGQREPLKKKGWLRFTVLVFVLFGVTVSADVSVQESRQLAMSASVLTNEYTVSVQAGDAVVLAVTGNKTASIAPITFSSAAGPLELVNNAETNPYPSSFMAYQIIQTGGTYDMRVVSGGPLTARSGLYVLRSDSGTVTHAASAKFSSTSLTTNDQTLVYNWSGDAVTNALAVECISSRYASVAALDSVQDYANGTPAKRYLGHIPNVTGSSLSSTYSLSLETTIGGVGLLFSELSAEPQPPAFNSDPVEGGVAIQDLAYGGSLADKADDPNGDTMFFSSTNGPAWLSVAADGSLSGTPLAGDLGTNTWSVLVTDGISGTNSATLQIEVLSGPPPPQTTATNIIMIVVDDLGWMDLSIQGSAFYETPRIDELAASGVRFTQGYAAHPRCLPSRYGLMTGRFPGANGVPAGPENNLRPWETTVAEVLQANGYATAFMGKWHLIGGKAEDNLPQNQGFDINISGGKPGAPPSYFYPYGSQPADELDLTGLFLDNTTPAGGMVTDRITGSSYLRTAARGAPGEYITDRLTDEALDWMDWNADKPMFLCMWHYGVHTPFEAPAGLVAKYDTKLLTMDYGSQPEYIAAGVGEQKMRQDHPVYAAMIESVDTNIGRLMDKVVAMGITSNTVFIFTSDNGGLSNRGGYNNRELATSNLPLRTGKGWLYEGGIREAFIVSGAGVAAMVNSNAVVTGTDIYPTCLELAGLPLQPSNHHDGVSFAAALKGLPYDRGAPIFWHSPSARPYSTGDFNSSAVRDGDFKLIWWYDTPEQNVELYNVKTDPGEQNDLSESDPARAAELLGKIQAWHGGAHEGSGVVFKSDIDDVSKPPQPWLDDPTVPVGLAFAGTEVSLSWGDWLGFDYNVRVKTNLLDASWTPYLSGTTATNAVVPAGDKAFYKVDLVLQPES